VPEIIALITARGASKGLPGKNIKVLAGKPLITWTIETALQSKFSRRVLVSTDDEGIASVSRAAGAEVPFLRPAELARDDSPHILSSLHAIEWFQRMGQPLPEYLLLLQPTSPLRTTDDIDGAIELAWSKDAMAVVSVCEARPHPQKTYRLLSDGTLADFMPCDVPYRRRQDLPAAYAENGAIYLNRCESLLRDRTYIPPGTLPYLMPPERSLDIDSAWDFAIAEFILSSRSAAGHQQEVSRCQ
jgi:CMP-N-acetylneuraminic acid synthetase